MNWLLPARQILLMQLGNVRGILQRNNSKACRGSLIPKVPILTEEETFARGNTMGQGLKEPSSSLRVARLSYLFIYLFIFGGVVALKRKLFALKKAMLHTVALRQHCFGKQRGFQWGCFRDQLKILAVLGRHSLSIKFQKHQKRNICFHKCSQFWTGLWYGVI